MRYFNLTLLFLISSIVFFNSCNHIESDAPNYIHVSDTINNQISHINIPIVYKVSKLEQLINDKLHGEIYKDDSYNNHNHDNLKLTIKKIDRIKLKCIGNKFYYTLPLNISVKFNLEKKVLGLKLHKQQGLDFSLVLDFKSSVKINHNWSLTTHTELIKLKWIKKPKIKVAFMQVSIAGLVENVLDKKMDELLGKLDKGVHEHLDIKSEVSKVWTGLQKPILINKKKPKIWLNASPKEIFSEQINGRKGYIFIDTKINTHLGTLSGSQPEKGKNITSLPNLKSLPHPSDSFDINILANLKYTDINQILDKKLKGKEIEVKGNKIKITEGEIYGSGEHLVLKLSTKGDFKGTIYLKGVPTYNTENHTLNLDNFDFDINSENVLVGSADWLLHDIVKSKIQKELHLPIDDKIQKLPELIQQGMSKGKLGKKIHIKLKIDQLTPKQILVNSESLQLLLNVDGTIVLALDEVG